MGLNGYFKQIHASRIVESCQAYYYPHDYDMHDPDTTYVNERPPSWRIIEGTEKLTAEGRYSCYVAEATATRWAPEQHTWTWISHRTGKAIKEFEIFPVTQELIDQEMAVRKVLGNAIPLIDRTGWIV